MNTAVAQNPQDLTNLLTARGLQLIVKPIPGAQSASHKHDLNILIMNRDELVRYAKPVTELEKVLYTHLKEMCETFGEAKSREELEEEFNTQHTELVTAQDECEHLKEQIKELEAQLVDELV